MLCCEHSVGGVLGQHCWEHKAWSLLVGFYSKRTFVQLAANDNFESRLIGLLCRSKSQLSERLGEQNPIEDINFIVSNFATKHVSAG